MKRLVCLVSTTALLVSLTACGAPKSDTYLSEVRRLDSKIQATDDELNKYGEAFCRSLKAGLSRSTAALSISGVAGAPSGYAGPVAGAASVYLCKEDYEKAPAN